MTHPIETHRVQQYTTNVQLLLQQRGSKLRGAVMQGAYRGKAGVPVDQYGPVTAQRRTTRFAELNGRPGTTDRRWVYPYDYDWDDRIDSVDKLRLLTDPMSAYVVNGAHAMGRAIDDEIIAAMFDDAKTGEAGGTTTTFLSGNIVDDAFGAAATCSLSVAKLLEARRLLMSHEVDLQAEPVFCAVTSKEHDALLHEIQVINRDYSSQMVLESGNITRFLGMNFIHAERLTSDGTYREVPVWVKSAMHLGMWNDISTDVSQRKDLAGLPWQVYVYGTFGATRTEEKKIVKIQCTA